MSTNSNTRKKATPLAFVVLIVVVAAGGYFGYRTFFGSFGDKAAAPASEQTTQQLSSTETPN